MNFLKFVKAKPEESEQDFHDPYIARLQKHIMSIKKDREMERRYMLLEELLKREYELGKAEGKAEGLSQSILFILGRKSVVPNKLYAHIEAEKDLELLDSWLNTAISSESITHFMKQIHFTI